MAAGGGRRWQDEVEPELRLRIRQQVLAKLTPKCRADHLDKLHSFAANIEDSAFSTAPSKEDYLRKISMKLLSFDQNAQRAMQAAAARKQQTQIAHQPQMGTLGGNSLLNPTLQAVSMMASHIRPPSQLLNRHMAGQNMQINTKHIPAMLNQNFNSQPATFAPVAPGIQSGQQIMQSSVHMQSQSQRPAVQFQSTSFASCYPTSVAQLQGQPVVQPNAQPNHLLKQNESSISGVMQQPRKLTWNNHHALVVNQQLINSQGHQMDGTNVDKLNIGYSGGLNNQQNVGWTRQQEVLKNQTNLEPQQALGQVTFNQQSNVHCPSPQTPAMENSSGEVDWREEIFQQIQSMKAACFSELKELNRLLVIPKITEEELRSLPKNKVDEYHRNSYIRNMNNVVLNFLQCQKCEISETYRLQLPRCQSTIKKLRDCYRKLKAHNEGTSIGQESQDCHGKPQIIDLTGNTAPFNGEKSNQPKRPADAIVAPARKNVVTTTPPAHQKTSSSDLLGVKSPNISIKSPGGLQYSPTNDVRVFCTPSPIFKSGVVQVASPYSSPNTTLQSSIPKPGEIAALHCASVMSPLTSTPEKSGVLVPASPGSPAKATLPLDVSKTGVVPVASPCHPVKSTASKDINNWDQTTPAQLIEPASSGQAQTTTSQTEDEVRAGAKSPVARRPIDRLLDAVRASSPAVLHSSVHSIKSALIEMDSVPFPPWGGFNNQMKRTYDISSSYSESAPFGGMDDSPVACEWDASFSAYSGEHGSKRQKIQNAKEALLDEIEDIYSTLIDTTICIIGDITADGITSCDGRTLIKLSYTPVSLAPSLKSHLRTFGMQPLVIPVTLLVPADYPASSPTIIDNEGDEQLRKKCGNISEEVDAAFRHALRVLPDPRSLKETASAWEACVRRVVIEFAHQHAGGAQGSRFGRWESCVGA